MKRVLLIVFIFSFVISCSLATKPNISVLYRIPTLSAQLPPLPAKSQLPAGEPLPADVQMLFQQLYILDPALALEVGKLPEFQGKIEQKQILALTKLTDLISKASSEEKSNLSSFLKVGKPEFRRYCTPIQAIFWLLEKEETYLKPTPLHYSLETLLRYAWGLWEKNRWDDFKIVTDRLNSPELINYYEQSNFRYVSHGGCPGNAKSIFIFKEGCCSDYTAFSEYCLRKAGYDAWPIKVVSPTGKSYHVVCEYKDKNGKSYIMDVDCYTCTGGRGILEKKDYVKKLPQIGSGYQ